MNKKKFIVILICMVVAIIITACEGADKHDKEEVEEYIEEFIGIKNYELSDNNTDKDSDGIIWHVKQTDGGKLEFNIYDRVCDSILNSYYSLDSDYESAANAYLAKQYGNFTYIKYVSEYNCNNILKDIYFMASYASRDEIKECFSEANEFIKYVAESEYPVNCNFIFSMDDINGAEYSIYTSEELTEENIQKATDACLLIALGYGLDDWLNYFTEEEISKVINKCDRCIGICNGNPDRDSYVYYSDIVALEDKQVSCRTLFQILKKEKYPVEGDENKYTFKGKDGSKYEICSKEVDNEYIYFSLTDINEMIGLNLCVGSNSYQPNAHLYAKDGKLKEIDNIYVNNEKIMMYNVNDNIKSLWYDEEQKVYNILVDADMFSYGSSDVIKEYVWSLGGTYIEAEDKNCNKSSWTIDEDKWTMSVFYDEDVSGNKNIDYVEIEKNGEKIDVDNLSLDSKQEINDSWYIGFTVDNFVRLFDMTYTIDQEKESVYFTR